MFCSYAVLAVGLTGPAVISGAREPTGLSESEFLIDQIKNFSFRNNGTTSTWKGHFELISEEETPGGKFSVYQFPLGFSDFTIYRRRFGIDVPAECLSRSCPTLFDFHGSYDSLFSQRYWTKWYRYLAKLPTELKFILVTPEGSPDAVTNPAFKTNNNRTGDTATSTTSWNVLGWGNPTVPIGLGPGCGDFPDSGCFESALMDSNSYPCFQTRLEMAPRSCVAMPFMTQNGQYELVPGAQMILRRICASTTAANDWDYLAGVLRWLWRKYDIDKQRIYFTGQSMGGMASLQFAVGKDKGSYWMRDFRPAAVVACSAGGARVNDMELHGKVKTLLMHGYLDYTAPATVWAGYTRDLSTLLQNDTSLTRLLTNETILRAMNITSNQTWPEHLEDQQSMVLEANLMAGGKLLGKGTQELQRQWLLGCQGNDSSPLPISRGGYMWEALNQTLARIVGRHVGMASELKFALPPEGRVPRAASTAHQFKCATVPRTGSEIEVCTFRGGHLYPFQDSATGDWSPEAGEDGQVFHDFIWRDWLKGGTVKRPLASFAADEFNV